MTDDEVIWRLREMLKLCDSEDDETFYALNRAIVAVSHMIWVPVTEGLPWHDDDYLVTVVNDCGTRRRQVSSFRLSGDGTCYSWGIETSPVYTVVAWAEMMPMWEEEKDET